jgi:hypothetical protein
MSVMRLTTAKTIAINADSVLDRELREALNVLTGNPLNAVYIGMITEEQARREASREESRELFTLYCK